MKLKDICSNFNLIQVYRNDCPARVIFPHIQNDKTCAYHYKLTNCNQLKGNCKTCKDDESRIYFEEVIKNKTIKESINNGNK